MANRCRIGICLFAAIEHCQYMRAIASRALCCCCSEKGRRGINQLICRVLALADGDRGAQSLERINRNPGISISFANPGQKS